MNKIEYYFIGFKVGFRFILVKLSFRLILVRFSKLEIGSKFLF